MIDVMNQKIFRLDDEIFFITNSVDKPHLYIKCSGKIVKKHSNKDNVLYLIQLQKVFVDVQTAKTHLHRRVFKTRKDDTGVAVMKKLYCSSFFENPETLSQNIRETLKHHLFVIPSVFVTDDYDDLQKLYMNAKETVSSKLKQFLLEIENGDY